MKMNLFKILVKPFKNYSKKYSEIVSSKTGSIPIETQLKPFDIQMEISKSTLGLSAEEFSVSKKTGTDLFLTPEKLNTLQNSGFFFEDANGKIDLEANSHKGWKLQYLKNMLLLQDYNNIFRDFLQCCALNNEDGLNLSCENRFKKYILMNLTGVNRLGYNLEIESLRILQDYKILRTEIYKNLKINRDLNKDYSNYSFRKVPTPLGPLVCAYENGKEHSIAKDQKPFIFATTMLVQTQMKMGIFNQNLTKKVHGPGEDDKINYVVRFETEMSYSDFAWILPTQNKPKRLRATKIADFNNIMRGNPFFENKFDLINEVDKYKYMSRNEEYDEKVKSFIYSQKY